MKKLIIKILVSLILIGITVGTFFIVNNLRKGDSIGTVNIKLYDIDEKLISDKNIGYNEDEKLIDLLEKNYKVRTSTSIYGYILLDIDDIKTDFKTTYIAIYVDDNYSNVGISGIILYDGMRIAFKEMVIYYS
jgi:hypothetical protein